LRQYRCWWHIREVVDATLKGEPLPDGFNFDQEKMWWAGLTDSQRNYVQQNITRGMARLVQEVQHTALPSEAIVSGEQMWFAVCDEEQKQYVFSRMRAMLAELVQEAQVAYP
jgi:hypothetical protein